MICPLVLALTATAPAQLSEAVPPYLIASDVAFGSQAASAQEASDSAYIGLVPGHAFEYRIATAESNLGEIALLIAGARSASPLVLPGGELHLDPSTIALVGSPSLVDEAGAQWGLTLSESLTPGIEVAVQAALLDPLTLSFQMVDPIDHVITDAQPEVISQLGASAHPVAMADAPTTLWIEDQEAWWTEWALAEQPGPAPEVDFEREIVAMVFAGYQPTGGYSITVDSIEALAPGTRLSATLTVPSPECIVTLATMSPSCFVTMDRAAAGPIRETVITEVMAPDCQ